MTIKAKFDYMHLPDLDEAVIEALNLFIEKGLPTSHIGNFKRPLVVGSGNAANTGQMLFHDKDAIFADESTFKEKLKDIKSIDGAVLITASGAKHGPIIAKYLKTKGIPTLLLTCTKNSEAAEFVDPDNVFVSPKKIEPYTYNISTYLGMIIGKTRENPKKILEFIHKKVNPALKKKDLQRFHSFFLLIPEEFDTIHEMFKIKFDELFGPKVSKRVCTIEQAKHGKTVIPSATELFISFGVNNTKFGDRKARLNIPLPKNADFGTMMAIGFYVIGHIQKSNPPWFKQNIKAYCEKASKDFGIKINPVVE